MAAASGRADAGRERHDRPPSSDRHSAGSPPANPTAPVDPTATRTRPGAGPGATTSTTAEPAGLPSTPRTGEMGADRHLRPSVERRANGSHRSPGQMVPAAANPSAVTTRPAWRPTPARWVPRRRCDSRQARPSEELQTATS